MLGEICRAIREKIPTCTRSNLGKNRGWDIYGYYTGVEIKKSKIGHVPGFV
jgi:hypothetical protein